MLTCANYDNAIRWKEGERLSALFEERCDQFEKAGRAQQLAVITEEASFTYGELDARANQTARYLLRQGIGSGDRVALLFDKSYHTYVALLAVLKINASYVPLDTSFPQERISYILKDADVGAVVTVSPFQFLLKGLCEPVFLDVAEGTIDAESRDRLSDEERGYPVDELCYIIYTSGSTGTPKGVAVEHPSICNFVKVASEVYGITEDDRVYQGMTIAFDFSVEELWVPLIAGATLVPGRPGARLVGADLADYLVEKQVSALCCVPTLLASIEEDIPRLRFLLVSGEACPQDLVARWHRPGRTILNAYGPTEATVTATWTELHPHKRVTIGQPLPTYSVVILSEDRGEAMPHGEAGEICIAGIGLAKGYLNRDELTQRSFIRDFLHIGNNPSGRIYRTGDLGRLTDDGEIEYLGRIDTQVKIRGYRIELAEIESVLLELPQIAQAVVSTYAPEAGMQELVAYYTLTQESARFSEDEIVESLRSRLPGYMIPAFLEKLERIPMLPSDKADRKKLPPPNGPRFSSRSGDFIHPRNDTEVKLASALSAVLGVDQISVADHFFDELGAHSLLMARFSTEVRGQCGLEVSMRDIYLHPTIAQLAEHLSEGGSAQASVNREVNRVASNAEYYGCAAMQLAYYAAYLIFALAILAEGVGWIASAENVAATYGRVVAFAIFTFSLLTVIPIAAKWTLVGRWREESIPIWGRGYFRFWVVKQLIRGSPFVLFKGAPLYNIYLRLLGAKIGRNVVIYSRVVPVCTDLIEIGDNTILRKDSVLMGYRAQSGYIIPGRTRIGSNAFVGEAAVLDIDTVMEDNTQLGHASSLHAGQRVPRGETHHGSPAERTRSNYCRAEAKQCGAVRRVTYSALQVLGLFFLWIPGPYLAALYLYRLFPTALDASVSSAAVALLPISALTFVGLLAVGLLVIATVPRLLNLLLKPDRTYVLYGIHYVIFRLIFGMSNSRLFNIIFGDSSYIVYYLKLIGYNLCKVVQTGSNFGTSQKHDVPFLCEVGTGTMVSDGISFINAQIGSTSFRLSKAAVGEDNYVGNDIHFPAEARTGKNCLLATKVLIPVDGEIRENTGLLGSPCFEIPRATSRDKRIAHIDTTMRGERIRRKNISNLVTVAGFLFFQWLYFYTLLFFGMAGWRLYQAFGVLGLAATASMTLVFTIAYFVILERLGRGFRNLKPRVCSIYDPYFWNVIERYWKFGESVLIELFKGTPFKTFIYSMLGVRMGRKVFDDGCQVTEKTLGVIGDYSTLNEGSVMQGHSLEEGVFKSDYVKIGSGCTIGCRAFVHYGVEMGDNVVLQPDSFLMKGEAPRPSSIWRGNPAKAT